MLLKEISKKSVYMGNTIKNKEVAEIANIPFIYSSYGFGNLNEYDYKIDDISELLSIFK